MAEDIGFELQRKIDKLERQKKLLEEGFRQSERQRQMFDQMAQELKATKSLLQQQSKQLEAMVQQRTRQLVAAQEELLRNEKLTLLGLVADTIGHELRNPLGVINNAVYFLQTVLPDSNASVKEYLGIIKSEIADAERIVSDLLNAVRTKPPQTETVKVAELIAQTLHTFDIPAAVSVKLDIPETLCTIRVDPVQMKQVLWNLICNAFEAMPQGGQLEIAASEDILTHAIRISIKDSGIGIAPAQQEKLFQALFTSKTRRIGLGLMVVKNLTQANGGRVEVNSELGKGATFSIVLQCSDTVVETA